MDYEKKYKDALERAKSIYNETAVPTPTAKGTCEYIFPELCESEDEKIKNEITSFLDMHLSTSTPPAFSAVTIQKWIAWLEKQGQVKESEISQHENKSCKEIGNSLTQDEDERIRRTLYGWVCIEPDSTFTDGFTRQQILAWLASKAKQKPTENIDAEKASEEYRNYRMSCGITDPIMLDEIEEAYYEGAIRKKSVEWSEEDEKMLDSIIKDFGLGCTSTKRQNLWLKSLRPQYKVEWSEVDTRLFDDIVDAINQTNWGTMDKQIHISLLKSLRPQNHWKPSEEQMKAIWIASDIGTANDSWAMGVLKDMYEQLKKL